ncbi:YxeA family protein [Lactococcus sp. DD01]|uniref:YxeA family protein n=1 Tax=Lactococcus sp. DD01 TaxID=1776443 RepID=UPI0007768F16|nr:YxeA family protein [Lactococcus sp. DD01]KXT62854.1 hypothetical protein LACDD01_00340 [Lactococcus sp. DD01]
MKKILFGFLGVLLILDIGFFGENISYTQTIYFAHVQGKVNTKTTKNSAGTLGHYNYTVKGVNSRGALREIHLETDQELHAGTYLEIHADNKKDATSWKIRKEYEIPRTVLDKLDE